MTSSAARPTRSREPESSEEPVDSGEPAAADSVLADAPDTTTGKEHLLQNDEGTPGPGV